MKKLVVSSVSLGLALGLAVELAPTPASAAPSPRAAALRAQRQAARSPRVQVFSRDPRFNPAIHEVAKTPKELREETAFRKLEVRQYMSTYKQGLAAKNLPEQLKKAMIEDTQAMLEALYGVQYDTLKENGGVIETDEQDYAIGGTPEFSSLPFDPNIKIKQTVEINVEKGNETAPVYEIDGSTLPADRTMETMLLLPSSGHDRMNGATDGFAKLFRWGRGPASTVYVVDFKGPGVAEPSQEVKSQDLVTEHPTRLRFPTPGRYTLTFYPKPTGINGFAEGRTIHYDVK